MAAKTTERGRRWRQENPIRNLFIAKRANAKSSGIEFSLSFDSIHFPSICPVLGIQLNYLGGGGRGPADDSPSFDRLDGSRGYVPGNVLIISSKANRLRSNGTLKEIRAVLQYVEAIERTK